MQDSKPSSTAIVILKSIVFLSLDSQRGHLVPKEVGKISTEFLETQTLNQKEFIKVVKAKWFHHFIWFLERLLLPGIILHYVLRKRYIEEATVGVINKEAIGQVVVLAAGFDSLACRLSKRFPQIRFIEVDHPATQRSKRCIFEEMDLLLPNVTFLAVDLSKDKLEEKLLTIRHFNLQTNTLFIAEGITMYLDESQINQLFSSISNCSSFGSRFIFTFMEKQEDGTIDFKRTHSIVNFWLNWNKEKFRWGISCAEMSNFLRGRKFLLEEISTDSNLRSRYLSDFPDKECLAAGESICITKTMGNL